MKHTIKSSWNAGTRIYHNALSHVSGSLFLMKGQPTGTYGTNLKIKAVPSKSCDPTKEPCERWLPGDYQVKIGKYFKITFFTLHPFLVCFLVCFEF